MLDITKLQRLRPNEYRQACAYCASEVASLAGIAAHFEGRKWIALHDDCVEDFVTNDYKAKEPTHSGPIAAKAVQAKADEDLTERLLTAPSLTPPDAVEMEALLASALQSLLPAFATEMASAFDTLVPPMVAELLASARPVAITVGDMPTITVKRKHKALEHVLLMVVAGTSPMLVGPAGSGKTTLAQQVAECMGRPFYMASRVTSEYKLTGFIDATGKVVRTAFREAYEHGGIFLFDEVDASDADALTAFNAALAGNLADFPDKTVQRHPDFAAIAAGNTFGRGADRQYVGRNQLDAATLDRFQVYEVDYDEALELALAGDDEWTRHVQRVRAAIEHEKVRHVVSPRASIAGAKLLAGGMERALVEEACIWKGLDTANRTRVVARMGGR